MNEKNLAESRRQEVRRRRLAARLARLGPILVGTITARTIEADDPAHPGQKKTYGPYYQWTYKEAGKTITRNLTAAQATVYQRAIDNHRALTEIVAELRALSLAVLEQTTPGVVKRSRR